MTPAELQKILQSDEKLSVKQVKEIIYQLQQDSAWQICKLSKSIDIDATKSMNDCVSKIEPLMYGKFYEGGSNAFYICLDLLEKVEEEYR